MNIVVGQSGGPTAVINASLYGVIQESLHYGKIDKIYGMVNGIEGFLEDKLVELNKLSPISMQLLKNTPSSFLGSCRYKLPEQLSDPVYKAIFAKLIEKNIHIFYYIGGNDSMFVILAV